MLSSDRADLVLAGAGAGGGRVGAQSSERVITGMSLIQWKENNPMEGTDVCEQERYCSSLCANLLDSSLEEFLHFLLSQVSTV